MMIDNVNGLPIGVLVVLGGIGIVLLAWVLMRWGSKIAKFLLALAGAGIGAVVAVALAAQSAANFEQSRATVEIAQVAQTANTSSMILVGVLGCAAGIAVVAVLALAGVAVFAWYRVQLAERQRQVQRPAMLPQAAPQQMTAGDFDLSWLDDDNWTEQGERAWQSNDFLHWS